jgi:HEAT repeat protein
MNVGNRRPLCAIAVLVLGIQAVACGESDPGFHGRPSEHWIAQLNDSSTMERAEAASALGGVLRLNPRYAPALDALIGALGDTSDAVRVPAAAALAREGVRAPGAVPGLIKVLADSAHPDVRAHGASVLGAVLAQLGERRRRGGAADDTVAIRSGVEALVSAAADRDARVLAAVARGLGGLGSAGAAVSPRVLPTLVAFAESPVPDLRVAGLQGLVNSGAPATLVVPAARSALGDSASNVRLAAARALERFGREAKAAIPELVRTLSDPNAFVRSASASAIGEIGPELARAPLERALKDPSASVRQEAAHALEGFHRAGKEDPPPDEPGRRRP